MLISRKERTSLLEVENNGEVLVLLDGRRLRVAAKWISMTCIWLPIAELEIHLVGKSKNVQVINLDEKERITATWIALRGGVGT